MPIDKNMLVPPLLELPSEILCQIVPHLSRHDLSVCVQVSRDWYHAFMDNLWHTVELKDLNRFSAELSIFHRLKTLYGPHLVIDGKEAMTTKSPFLRNLHRIRVLRVQYTSFLNLFWDQSEGPLESIPLEELSVEFEDDPENPLQIHLPGGNSLFGQLRPAPEPLKPTNIEAVLQILKRSTRLSTFAFMAGVLSRKQQLEDQARLLASLPACLETLNMTSDSIYHGPPAAEVDQERKSKALDLFLELKMGDCFSNLTALTMAGMAVDMMLLVAMLEHSPKLRELNMDGYQARWKDSELAEIVSKVSSKSWKTLGFMSLAGLGPLTVAAILQSSGTLENLRLPSCKAFDSKSIQKLLCSAPNLRRFDLIPCFIQGELEPYSLMAMDIVESAEDWVCLELETFKCYIGGVPRPDINCKKNGRPLTGIYNGSSRYSMSESRAIQRRVLAQLGRLTKLRVITFGKDVVDYESGNHQAHWNEEDMEGEEYYSSGEYELGSQYQCLTMSLQDGLDELKGLKYLQRLTLEKMSLEVGDAEQAWMKENWPEYGKESRDSFWTSRGHSVGVGTDLFYEKFQIDFEEQDALKSCDWW